MFLFFFFFQAEDGIRDADVTGVQTCALPICYLKNFIEYVEGLDSIDKTHVYENIYNDIFFSRAVKPYQYEDLFPLQELEFEGYKFFAPRETTTYLSNLYGENFITPPPEKMRKPYSKSLDNNKLSVFLTRKLIWTLYKLKAIKGSSTLTAKIKRLKQKSIYNKRIDTNFYYPSSCDEILQEFFLYLPLIFCQKVNIITS